MALADRLPTPARRRHRGRAAHRAGTHPASTRRRRGVAPYRWSLDQVRAATGGAIGQPRSPCRRPVQGVSLERARAMVDFTLGVPGELGAPEHVSVSADRRVVSMEWGSGRDRIHLDQFDGRISWVFVKRVWSQVTPTAVGGRDAAWIADTHEIVYTDRDGTERRAEARISGPCLVWERLTGSGTVTLRLEGDLSMERAVRDRRIRTLGRRTRQLVAVYGQ